MQDAPASLLGTPLELAYYLPDAQDYIVLPCSSKALNSAESSALLLLAEAPAAALEWQLSWVAPAGEREVGAAALLPRLRINPPPTPALARAAASLGLVLPMLPPPLGPVTLALTADTGSLSLLAPASQPATGGAAGDGQQDRPVAVVHSVAVLHADGLRLAVHSWPELPGEAGAATAVDLQALLSLSYTDSSSLVAVVPGSSNDEGSSGCAALVEPFTLDVAVELCSPAGQPMVHVAAAPPPPQPWTAFWQPAVAAPGSSDLALLAVRGRPAQPGTAVLVQAGVEPLQVNLSELSIHELQRLAGLASDMGDAAAPPAVTISNATGMDLLLRQQGTGQQLLLAQGATTPFHWPAPPPLFPGAVRQLLLAWAPPPGLKGSDAEALAWSKPIEVGGLAGLPEHTC